MTYDVRVEVQVRAGVSDPQGATVERALPALGFTGVHDVKVGKSIRFQIDAGSEEEARSQADALCSTFLTNPVIEDATITVEAR